jgi:hypothetical protein
MRLETLKNGILLEDTDDIEFQIQKLIRISSDAEDTISAEIAQIIENVGKKQYAQTVVLIESFVSRFRGLSVYMDAEVVAMQLEINTLGVEISSLEDEKAEIEKLLYAFNIRYNQELGELMTNILELRKEKLQKEAKTDPSKAQQAQEAEADYEEFNQSFKESKKHYINELTEEQQAELKQKYRKAAKLCHPDLVGEEQAEIAKEMFQRLKNAYDKNDLDAVTQILSDLEKGIFTDKTTNVSEKQKLNAIVSQLRINRDELEKQLIALKESETYQTILKIEDWDAHFAEMKGKLQRELDGLLENME